MSSHALHDYPASTSLPRWLVTGFISGFIAVLLFHQGMAFLLHALEWTPRVPYSFEPTRPFGVPQLWSIAFWGGVWGAVLAAALGRLTGAGLIVAGALFGAVLPTLVAWFIVAPLKGQPMAAGGVPIAMAVGVLVNGAWGLGTAIGLALFGRSRGRTAGNHAHGYF
jgi:hypothetical protein